MFCASPGCMLVGADFSQAEPRLLAAYSGDTKMIDAYKNKQDLYATVASTVYNNNYEDNLEFYPDGTINYEGKERRTSCKSIILGIMYGRGAPSIAEQTGKSIKEAQEIIDKFYDGFPAVKTWIDETKQRCREVGYVETLNGRRRRLPDIQLPPYTIKFKEGETQYNNTFNPFLECKDGVNAKGKAILDKYKKKCEGIKSKKDYEAVKQEASYEGVVVSSNTAFIGQAERQSANARIQGGSADITKKAMIAVANDPLMKELDFHLLLCVHDELIGECPEASAEKVGQRLVELMLAAPKPECDIPFKTDFSITHMWYAEEYQAWVQEDYMKLLKSGTKEEAFRKLVEDHEESTVEQLEEIIKDVA